MNDDTQKTVNEAHARTDVFELSEFTVPVEQAAEMFKAAGFPRSEDHISRWCRQGVLKAIKEPTKNRLTRYIIDRASIENKIEQLRSEQQAHNEPSVFATDTTTTTQR